MRLTMRFGSSPASVVATCAAGSVVVKTLVLYAIMITGAYGATMLSKVLGFIAITAAVTNIVSGYLITDRMLKMFKKPGGKK